MISIIVPIYNGEQYIARCIDCIRQQTYKDWELILVDDGSKDNSSEVCNSYVCDKVHFYHKENGGVSSARNYGLQRVVGEYVSFIDVDDIVSSTYLENLAKGINADFVITGYCYNDSPHNTCDIKGHFDKKGIATNLSTFLSSDDFCYPWARMFKTEIIKNNNLCFDEKIRFAEDHVFNWTYLKFINTLYIDKSTDYHQTIGSGGEGYKNLSFEEINYIDNCLYELKSQLERIYNTRFDVIPKQTFHVLFKQDYITFQKASFYAKYYLKYHDNALLKDGYDFTVSYLFHPALHQLKLANSFQDAKKILDELNDFCDKPISMIFCSSIKSRIFIPLIKLNLYRLVWKMVKFI